MGNACYEHPAKASDVFGEASDLCVPAADRQALWLKMRMPNDNAASPSSCMPRYRVDCVREDSSFVDAMVARADGEDLGHLGRLRDWRPEGCSSAASTPISQRGSSAQTWAVNVEHEAGLSPPRSPQGRLLPPGQAFTWAASEQQGRQLPPQLSATLRRPVAGVSRGQPATAPMHLLVTVPALSTTPPVSPQTTGSYVVAPASSPTPPGSPQKLGEEETSLVLQPIEQEYIDAIDAVDPVTESVYMHVYDLSDSATYVNKVVLDMLGYGGILHVGIEVFGEEFSFGMQGMTVSQPKWHQQYRYRRSELIGRTRLKRAEVLGIVVLLRSDWTGDSYNLLSRNCGTFCNTLCQRLGVGSLPAYATCIGEALSRMPVATRLATAFQDQVRESLEGDEEAADLAQRQTGANLWEPPMPQQPSPWHARIGVAQPLTMGQQRREAIYAMQQHQQRRSAGPLTPPVPFGHPPQLPPPHARVGAAGFCDQQKLQPHGEPYAYGQTGRFHPMGTGPTPMARVGGA
eukprot:TRINITY_DN15959_c0_g1_i3.p1 TRINITY_DN15959_c0_g1~~TRINITY_DN15959_c0_g1_i3.p1  ORF type:complete len:539 (+),score=96.44 TRINITY_DN15959_c0_g1_i3:71-1618(+)